jgi:SAM-dependent methyltransferase
MKAQTIEALNAINRDFYTRAGTSFSETRERAWQGWETLRVPLTAGRSAQALISVLDVGAGNARFAEFLASHLGQRIDYLGVDFSPVLLHLAKTRLDRIGDRLERGRVAGLDLQDLLSEAPGPLPAELANLSFSLVSMFGLFHHVAARHRRRRLLEWAKERLAQEGLIAISIWRFMEFPRMRQKVLSWEEYNQHATDKLELSDLEEGDFLLRWAGETPAHRYCHYSSEAEMAELFAETGLEVVSSFEADGVEGALNRYYLLRPAIPPGGSI